MRHRNRTFRVGRNPSHRRHMVINQVCSVILDERIKTTVTKAKETRRFTEKMITLAKHGKDQHRRRATAFLGRTDVVDKLFAKIGPRFMERVGGYTRIIRLGKRIGDAADMCYLELLQANLPARRPRKKAAAEAAEPPAEGAAAKPAEGAAPAAEKPAAQPVEAAAKA